MDTNLFVADFIFSRRFLNGNRPPYKMVYSMQKIKFNPYSKSLMVVMAEKALQPSLEIKLLQNVSRSGDRCDHVAHLIKNPFQLIIFLLHHNFRSITVVHLAQMHRRADIHFCSPCTGYLLAAELLALISQPLHENIRFFVPLNIKAIFEIYHQK